MKALLFVLAAGISGCATQSVQTRDVLKVRPDIPAAVQLKEVPFIAQESGQCGPASLAMVMQASGEAASASDLRSEVDTPGKGAAPMDMISAVRRHGLMGVPLDGLREVLKQVAAGKPVLVFENLAFAWLPQWHYAVVTGYDLDRQEIWLHSGQQAFVRVPFTHFESAWSKAGYWALAVVPPQELAVSADELAHARAAAGLEQAGRLDQAETAYRAILSRWPKSVVAWIGLGNIAFTRGDALLAVRFLREAVTAAPQSHQARHNLAVAEQAARAGVNR